MRIGSWFCGTALRIACMVRSPEHPVRHRSKASGIAA
jgi:hypothetical protein